MTRFNEYSLIIVLVTLFVASLEAAKKSEEEALEKVRSIREGLTVKKTVQRLIQPHTLELLEECRDMKQYIRDDTITSDPELLQWFLEIDTLLDLANLDSNKCTLDWIRLASNMIEHFTSRHLNYFIIQSIHDQIDLCFKSADSYIRDRMLNKPEARSSIAWLRLLKDKIRMVAKTTGRHLLPSHLVGKILVRSMIKFMEDIPIDLSNNAQLSLNRHLALIDETYEKLVFQSCIDNHTQFTVYSDFLTEILFNKREKFLIPNFSDHIRDWFESASVCKKVMPFKGRDWFLVGYYNHEEMSHHVLYSEYVSKHQLVLLISALEARANILGEGKEKELPYRAARIVVSTPDRNCDLRTFESYDRLIEEFKPHHNDVTSLLKRSLKARLEQCWNDYIEGIEKEIKKLEHKDRIALGLLSDSIQLQDNLRDLSDTDRMKKFVDDDIKPNEIDEAKDIIKSGKILERVGSSDSLYEDIADIVRERDVIKLSTRACKRLIENAGEAFENLLGLARLGETVRIVHQDMQTYVVAYNLCKSILAME